MSLSLSCAVRPHISDVSVNIVRGLNSRSIIVIASRVCPRLESLTGSFVWVLVLDSLFVKDFVVHLKCLVKLFGPAIKKYVYSAKVSCPVSPNMPTDRIFKST